MALILQPELLGAYPFPVTYPVPPVVLGGPLQTTRASGSLPLSSDLPCTLCGTRWSPRSLLVKSWIRLCYLCQKTICIINYLNSIILYD